MKNIFKNKFQSAIMVLLIMLIPGISRAQYNPGTVSISTAASPGPSSITDLNCDTRNFNDSYTGAGMLSPMNAIAYDDYYSAVYWDWQDGPTGSFYSGSIPLSTVAHGADVVILYNSSRANAPFLGVVYFDYLFGNVVFNIYQFSKISHTFSLFSTNSYSASPTLFPRIDADARGNFVLAWDSGLQLKTVGGHLVAWDSFTIGPEKTLPFPTGITDASFTDVALYGKANILGDCRAYYTYVSGSGQTLVVQTQKLSNVITLTAGVPSAVYDSYTYTTSSSYVFGYPRIAANMFEGDANTNNGAEEMEYTVVCSMYENVTPPQESSIFVMTSYYNSGAVESEYNLTSNNFTGTPYNQRAFLNSGGYMTPENIANPANSVNSRPVVAYDRDNDHVIICWSMQYGETTYATNFPSGFFPAMVYANPEFDKSAGSGPTSYPSLQPTVTGSYSGCEINGLDNTATGGTASGATIVAVAGHNMDNILYAWFDGNGDVNFKHVTSGSLPRLADDKSAANDHFVYPNPWNREGADIRLDLEPNQHYTMKVVNVLGQFILNVSGYKEELVSELNASLKNCDPGIYQVNISDGNTQIANTKLSVY